MTWSGLLSMRHLLRLEDALVLAEDRGDALAQLVRPALLGDLVVAGEGPEIVAGLVGLGRHGVEHEAVDALRLRSPSGAPVPVGATPTSMAMVDGASKLMICQRSTLPGLPSWPRQNGGASMSIIQRVMVAVVSEWVARERRFGHRAVADRGAMHIGLVRQVHEVVDDQPVVALGVD